LHVEKDASRATTSAKLESCYRQKKGRTLKGEEIEEGRAPTGKGL